MVARGRPQTWRNPGQTRRIFSGEPQRFGHRHFTAELHRVHRGAGPEEHGLPLLRHTWAQLDRVGLRAHLRRGEPVSVDHQVRRVVAGHRVVPGRAAGLSVDVPAVRCPQDRDRRVLRFRPFSGRRAAVPTGVAAGPHGPPIGREIRVGRVPGAYGLVGLDADNGGDRLLVDEPVAFEPAHRRALHCVYGPG